MPTECQTLPEVTTRLASLFAPIASELSAASAQLQRELHHADPFIDELARHSFRMGGKRLRPALLLLAAAATGKIRDEHRVLASVVEMIHTATLVHDDVLDEAAIRRHEETVNARWSNQTSVLLGDYLFTHAFYLASTLETTFGCRTIGRATNTVCEGELLQTAASGNFHLAREDYLKIIDAKTAALCACCCELGAHYAEADSATVEQLTRYGRNLGIAFQIADDLLDLAGEETHAGKSLGTDFAHCKMTLPLIHLRDQLSEDQQGELELLCKQPSPANAATLLDWLRESGSLEHAQQAAADFAQQAANDLVGIDTAKLDKNSRAAYQSLVDLAEFVVSRNA